MYNYLKSALIGNRDEKGNCSKKNLKKVIMITSEGGDQQGSMITFYFIHFFVPNVLKIISRH